MIKFNEEEKIASVRGALALRSDIERIVDSYKEVKNLCYLGIGGTWASSLQTICHMKEHTQKEVFATNAAIYVATGDRRIGAGTVIVISSVSGTTKEIVEAIDKAHADGASVIGFIDKVDTPLSAMVDHLITYPANEQLKFFMTADRFMKNWGEFDEYDEFYRQMDQFLPEGLAGVEKQADAFGEKYAQAHYKDQLHYFVGAGNIYGATYSYAMCYWEEQHHIRTKSIHSAEFFHGTLEIVERDTAVTLFIGEDSQRALGLRVANFLPKVCDNYTIIDVADYEVPGIDSKFRGNISHLIMRGVANRMDAHIEALSGRNMNDRIYYRKMDY